MPDLIPFLYNGREVPVQLNAEGNPLWRAVDVGKALDYKGDMGQYVRRLDEDERTLISNQGGSPEWWVTEAGLYTLILGSRKPGAKAFKRWITHEVVPAIRKHGYYTPAKLVGDPVEKYPELCAIRDLLIATAEARDEAALARQEAQQAHVEAAEATQLAQHALHGQEWLSLRQYVLVHGLERQLPESLQKDYGKWLVGYCMQEKIPVYKIRTADRAWQEENTYHSETINTTLPGWLTRRYGQTPLTLVEKPIEGEGTHEAPVPYRRRKGGR